MYYHLKIRSLIWAPLKTTQTRPANFITQEFPSVHKDVMKLV
jgi:hypothetical protein